MIGDIGVLVQEKQTLAYDLFAVAMIMINTVYPNRFNKKEGGILQLRTQIKQSRTCRNLNW